MSTTITQNTFAVQIVYTADELAITSKTTGKRLIVDRRKVSVDTLEDDEYLLYNQIIDEGLPNRVFSLDLTKDEGRVLKSIHQKCSLDQPTPAPVQTPIAIPAPVVAPAAPAPVVVPVVVQPAPVAAQTTPVGPEEERAARLARRQAEVEQRRLERIASLEALRTAKGKAANNAIISTVTRISRHSTRNGAIGLEERIKRLSTQVRNLDGVEFYQIEYDIPDAIQQDCPNPAGWLWRYACHLGLSKWTITKAKMECQDVIDFFARCQTWGATLNVFKLDESENAHIRALAQEELRTLLIEAHTSLITGIAKLDDELNEFVGPETLEAMERREDKRDNQVRAKLKIAAERLQNAICAAEVYDDSAEVGDLIDGLRAVIAGEQEMFNARMQRREKADRLYVQVV